MLDFPAAHALRGYQGPCARTHGHNWKVEVIVTGHTLDKLGISLDFREMKQRAKKLINQFDHQFLNEIEPFDKLNPTAENIAYHFFQILKQEFNREQTQLSQVIIWETDQCYVSYSE